MWQAHHTGRSVILVTYRADELTRGHPLTHLLPSLVREAGAARLDLHALDAAAVQAFESAATKCGRIAEVLEAYRSYAAEAPSLHGRSKSLARRAGSENVTKRARE